MFARTIAARPFLLLLGCLFLWLASTVAAQPAREPATVLWIIDDDTVEVRVGGRIEKVRLIGLNTPETVDPRRPVECFGREASAYTKQFLPRGLRIELEADPTPGNRNSTSSRRLLRYIWPPDGRNVAEGMIGEDYGVEYTYRLPCRYQDRFQAVQREARAAGRGLWAPACGHGAAPPSDSSRPAVTVATRQLPV